MKILCVVSSYWPAFQHGGPIYSVHTLNKALVKRGVGVSVYTTNVGLKEKVPVNQMVEVDGVRVTYFSFAKFFEFMGATGWQFSLPLTRALKNNLKVFDIIYTVGIWNYPIAIAAYYSRIYKKPYIISPRGHLYPYTIKKKFWKKWFYYYFIARRVLRNAWAIHYTTKNEFENCHLSLELKNKAIVIPNGIDISEFSVPLRKERLRERYLYLKDKKVILFLGRVNWKKGLDILVKAYGRLAKERDDVHLLIVGSDEEGYGEKVKGWILDYGMSYWDYGIKEEAKADGREAKVTFAGMLKGRERLEAYAGCDIFVLPSYSENFGMAVVEAMTCGLPVVISNKVGIHRKIEKNKAGIVVDTNTESLYMGIKLLLENPELKKEVAINGKELVEECYDIDKVADRMMEVYERVLIDGVAW